MKISIVSLGCDKNLVDSHAISSVLSQKGCELTDDIAMADIAIINTCCFIVDAKEESISAILDVAQYKEVGTLKKILVTGCMAQRYKDEILKEIPEVDAIVGINDQEKIYEILTSDMDNIVLVHNDISSDTSDKYKGAYQSGSYYGYLKISDGCDKHCTYCIIPKLRGKYHSYSMQALIKQAEDMATSGTKELILVAQETTLYGIDLYGKKMLPELLRKLCLIDGLEWIRILYCYPEEITDELLEVIRDEKKICKYLDIPIQHASDAILKKMGRRATHASLIETISHIRQMIPDIAIRTTLISGFPGESEEDHHIMLDFVRDIEFERLGVFTYSREEETPAATFDNQIDENVKQDRKDELMALQMNISKKHTSKCIGRVFSVIIDGRLEDENVYVGRTYMDLPDIDSMVFIETDRELLSGTICDVKITSASDYDLYGEVIG